MIGVIAGHRASRLPRLGGVDHGAQAGHVNQRAASDADSPDFAGRHHFMKFGPANAEHLAGIGNIHGQKFVGGNGDGVRWHVCVSIS